MIHNCCSIIIHKIYQCTKKDYHLWHTHRHANPNTYCWLNYMVLWVCHHRPNNFTEMQCSARKKVPVWYVFEKVHAPSEDMWHMIWTDRSKCHLNCSEFLSFYCRKKVFFSAFFVILKALGFNLVLNERSGKGIAKGGKRWWEYCTETFWCLFPFYQKGGDGEWEFMVRMCA